MFDWDKMVIKKPTSAEELYEEAQKKKRFKEPSYVLGVLIKEE